jgi:cell division protease FtsH
MSLSAAIAVAVVIVAIALFRARGGVEVPHVPFSELLHQLDNGAVTAVIVSGDTLEYTLADGRTLRTVAPSNFVTMNAAFVPELARKGIRVDVRAAVEPAAYSYGALGLGVVFIALLGLTLYRVTTGRIPALESKTREAGPESTSVTFADVAGVDEAKEEVREIVDFLREPERFSAIGGRIPKGVLLVGPPGTGKTLLARSIAGEAKAPFLFASGSDFVEMYAGVGASRIRRLFKDARRHPSCIVFIDELDAVGRSRGGNSLSHEEREQTLNQLLAEMDGFDARKGLIIMAATNRPETLDSALMRPGRFDRQVLVDKPDKKGREAILRVHARGVKFTSEVDLTRVAALTPGMAGADLANLINEAALLAARRNKDAVGPSELNEAIERGIAGLEKKNRLMNTREKEIVAHHESGHALLAEILPTTDRVHKVSMIPRGLGALGYTMQLPLEDRYLMTRPELLDKLTVLMGGRAAEKVVFNEVSTGAADDLQRATDLARRMIAQFGMSTVLGPQSVEQLGGAADQRFLQVPQLVAERGYSERTQQLIDQEVSELLKRAFERAVALLEHNRGQLLALAARLREKEVIEGDELRQALEGAEAPPALQGPDELQWAQLPH